jgi:hypothetical protein
MVSSEMIAWTEMERFADWVRRLIDCDVSHFLLSASCAMTGATSLCKERHSAGLAAERFVLLLRARRVCFEDSRTSFDRNVR